MTARPPRYLLGLGLHSTALSPHFRLHFQLKARRAPLVLFLHDAIIRRAHKGATFRPQASTSIDIEQKPKAVVRSPSTSQVELNSRINPPASTLPAPISLPEREKDQKFISYAWRTGRAYLSFYKTGLKAIFANRRAAGPLRHHLNSKQTPQLPPSPYSSSSSSSEKDAEFGETPQELASYPISRAEFQLLRRSRHDVSRIPIFALLFAILGEWLPLVVFFFTPLVPYTCRIPKQVDRALQAAELRRKNSFRAAGGGDAVPTPYVTDGKVPRRIEELSKPQLLHVSRSLGLHARLWDVVTRDALPPALALRWLASRRLAYLRRDDLLLQRDSKMPADSLSSEEVKRACVERGIDILGRNDAILRPRLKAWLKGQSHGKAIAMLLSRPSAWDSL